MRIKLNWLKLFKQKRFKFLITEKGFVFKKTNKFYKWDEIIKIIGYWEFQIDSDNVIINFMFYDEFVIEIDESFEGFLNLMDIILPNNLDGFNTNWYRDIHSCKEEYKKIILYLR